MIKLYSALIMVAFILFLIPTPSNAQEFSAEISPSILIFDTEDLKPQKFIVKNASNKAIELTPKFYTITDTKALDGSISVDKENANLAGQIKVSENNEEISSIKLEALESRQISITYQPTQPNAINFFTILWHPKSDTAEAETETSMSHINPGIGQIILATNTARTAKHPTIFWTPSRFQKSGPLEFDITLENPTSELLIVTPQISIYNLLNQNVGTIQLPTQYLLPESKRRLKQADQIPAWDDPFVLGPYNIKVEVADATEEKVLLQEATTFVLPLLPIVVLSFIIFFMLGVYLRVRNKS